MHISEDGEEETLTAKEKDERRIAEMGRPMLGDNVKLEVVIEESYEFKVQYLSAPSAIELCSGDDWLRPDMWHFKH